MSANGLSSAAGGLPILTPEYLQAHVVGTSGRDVIWEPLRDALAYPSAGALAFTFFNLGIGAGLTSEPGAGAGTKTFYDTNVSNQNMLPAGQQFYIIGSETHFIPGAQPTTGTPYAIYPNQDKVTSGAWAFANDIWVVLNAGHKIMTVNTDRKYIDDGPLYQFPPAKWFHFMAAIASNTATTNATTVESDFDYGCSAGEPYLIVPVYLQSTVQFTLQVSYAAAIPTVSGSPGRLIERLRGYKIRQIT